MNIVCSFSKQPRTRQGRLAVWAALMVLASSAPASVLTHNLAVDMQGVSYRLGDIAADEAGLADAITLRPAFNTASAVVSVGRYGDLGIQSNLWGTGQVVTSVFIGMEPAGLNPFGVPRHAQGRFIVDGGSMTLIAGPGSEVDLEMTYWWTVHGSGQDVSTGDWYSRVRLTSKVGGVEMETAGASLDAAFDGQWTVDIPFSAQTFDIGDIPAGGWVDIDYWLKMSTWGNYPVEYVHAQFSDPLHVDGAGAFSVAFVDGATSMPEPSTGALAAVAALGLVPGCRRRRRAVSTTASRQVAGGAACSGPCAPG